LFASSSFWQQLAVTLALLSGGFQLAVAFRVDLLLTPGQHHPSAQWSRWHAYGVASETGLLIPSDFQQVCPGLSILRREEAVLELNFSVVVQFSNCTTTNFSDVL
jgi:hypothetical protein